MTMQLHPQPQIKYEPEYGDRMLWPDPFEINVYRIKNVSSNSTPPSQYEYRYRLNISRTLIQIIKLMINQ